MKKVLFFIQNGVGGAERMTVNIAKLLDSNSFDLTFCKICFPFATQNGRIDDFIPKGVKLTNIFWNSQTGFIRQLYKMIKITKPDVVFASTMPYNQRLMLLKPLFPQVKFVIRNDNYLFTLSKIKKLALKYTYRNASLIVAQTEEMRDEFIDLGLNPDKIKVLHNFIDTDLISCKANEENPFHDNNEIRFVAVGRFARQKGYDLLIDAFKLVCQRLNNAHLYIIGDNNKWEGNVYPDLLEQIKQNGLVDKVHFTGYTDNPYKYIKNASAFVLSSRYEGLPNVLIEAQFLNIPSAAFACIPIIKRMIKDGENGYIAKAENPASLADAMIKAIDLKNVEEIYKPSSKEDFISLFN